MDANSTKGRFAQMQSPKLPYKVTVADKTDNGSVMDTARPASPYSNYPQFLTNQNAYRNNPPKG